MVILADGSVLRTCRSRSKCHCVVWRKVCCSSHDMILSLCVAGAGLCAGFEVWYGSAIFVAGAGNREVALDVWRRKVSWQAQKIVRLRVVVEVNSL